MALFIQSKRESCTKSVDILHDLRQLANDKCVADNNRLKEGLQSVLRIGSAHNKGGPPNINLVQISHFSNSF